MTGHTAMCETTLHYDVIYVGRKRVLNLHIHNDTTLSEFGRLLTSCNPSCKFLSLVSCSDSEVSPSMVYNAVEQTCHIW